MQKLVCQSFGADKFCFIEIKMKFMIFILLSGLLGVTFAAPRTSIGLRDDDNDNGVVVRNTNIEERASSGILALIQSIQGLLQTIIGILEGNASVPDLANSMQKVFTSLQSVLDVRGVVTNLPVVGVYLSPAIDAVSAIVGDSGMLGGLMSQVMTGPDYPSDPIGKPPIALPISSDILTWFQ